jgi:hypothetical protein
MSTFKYSSNDVSRNRPSQDSLVANKAISVSDAGRDQNSSGGSHSHTLPELRSSYIGMTFRIRNIGTANTDSVTISPHANDKISGSFSNPVVEAGSNGVGVNGKHIINTGATSIYGDYVEVCAISATEWIISSSIGIWAFEA